MRSLLSIALAIVAGAQIAAHTAPNPADHRDFSPQRWARIIDLRDSPKAIEVVRFRERN